MNEIKNVLIGVPVKNCGDWLENDSEDYSHVVIEYCIEKLLKKYNYRSINGMIPFGG